MLEYGGQGVKLRIFGEKVYFSEVNRKKMNVYKNYSWEKLL